MKIVFLDRDGVINRFPGKGLYVTRQEDFHFLPRALDAIRLLTQAGCEIYVVSNQGCVSRRLITEKALAQMTGNMMEAVRQHGGRIDKVFYCVHQKTDLCECKKPKLKLFYEAFAGRQPDLNDVFFAGDSEEDIQAGKALGCRTVLVLSGRTTPEDLPGFPLKPDAVKIDLWEAAEWMLQKKS